MPLDVWLNVMERQKRMDIGMAAAQNPGAAGTLAGAGIGAATGGLIGALVDLGVPEEQANLYAESVRRGSGRRLRGTAQEPVRAAV